ncbi:MAG: hypothetical protein J0H68_01645 [Sphingobacteriia bacterium]|nr:hypothetical protein [Sphingobacteriia bacterium]
MDSDISKKYSFNQGDLICNGYMNKEGTCAGLSVDWLKFNKANPAKNYFEDKYYKKAYTVEKHVDGIKVICDQINSDNFYNRINYYQEMYNNLFNNKYSSKASHNFLLKQLETPDNGIITLISSYSSTLKDDLLHNALEASHVCAYKINKTENGFNYQYFDPNFGELISISYPTREMAVNKLHDKIADDMVSIPEYSIFKDFIFQKNIDQFIRDINLWWKEDKPFISGQGIGKNSLSHNKIEEFVNNKLDNSIREYKGLLSLKIEGCLNIDELNEVPVFEITTSSLEGYYSV